MVNIQTDMKKLIVISALVVIGISGCHKEESLSQVHNFTGNTWQRFIFLNFEFNIEKPDQAYDILVVLRYNDEFPSQALLVNLAMFLPSGEERVREYKLEIRDKEDNLLGEKKAGYYERIIPVRREMRFYEPGLLKFEIENLMTKYYTPGLVEFGIVLEPSE